MPNQESTKSSDETLRQVVEKNLAKEKTSKKSPKIKQLDNTKSSRKQSFGKFEKTRVFRFLPKFRFITSSFGEIKLVSWPSRRDTLRLTSAVIIFSVIFGIMISLLDWGFEIIFKKVFLHG